MFASILLVYVSLPFSGNSRDVISLVEQELMQGHEYSSFVSILPWQVVHEEAGCHPKPIFFSVGWMVPHEDRGGALGAPLPCIITPRTSNNLAVTSVVLCKKLAWFISEAAVFMVCMSVKSACLSWGSRNPSAYQYHCIHSSLTRIDSNVKDSDGSEKCPCFILTLSVPVDTLADYCT